MIDEQEDNKIKRTKANPVQDFVRHDKQWTACYKCNRGGNGNDKDKCSCGGRCTVKNGLGCYLGTKIVGEIKPRKKVSRSKQRYQRFLEYGDGFHSFLDYCRWDAAPGRSWNSA